MATTVNFIGDDSRTTYYKCAAFDSFLQWIEGERIIALDTETNVVDSILERHLKVVAIGDEEGKVIWVLQFEFLSPQQKAMMFSHITKRLCIIHNVSFDYQVLLKYGCMLTSVFDTMVAEQILTCGQGEAHGYHGLQAIYQRRFELDISKDEQLTFGDTSQYDDNQVDYAALDVIKLGTLRRLQLAEMRHIDKDIGFSNSRGLVKTSWWENEFVMAIGDCETTGIRFDKEQWYKIQDDIQPIWDEEIAHLNKIVVDDFSDTLYDNGFMFHQDTFVEPIWTSAKKKIEILGRVFDPAPEKTSSVELKKYLKEHDPDFPEGLTLSGKKWNESPYPTTLTSKYAILKLLIMATGEAKVEMHQHLDAFLLSNFKDLCIEKGWLVPADSCTLKWTSPAQKLKVFRAIDPFIESTGKEIIAEYIDKHPIIAHYLKWSDVDYQRKMFGRHFYDKWVQLDGKHRTRFNTILSTGRLSSVNPNILNIPRKKQVFRMSVIPDPGYDFINSDFDGQEMVVTATLAGEETWLEALRNGWDLHSRNADLVFGDEWIEGTEEHCEYYHRHSEVEGPDYKKCSCPKHEELRDAVKAVGFGLIYGISKFALSARLDITVDAAAGLMKKFFDTAPAVKEMMDNFGDYGLSHGFIVEPVFGRIRWFDKWKLATPAEHGGIQRQSYNFPIQASGSALLKIAMVLLRRAINQRGLRDKIQILMPYHDEISIQATPEYSDEARDMLEYCMRRAGKVAGFPLLGASAAVGESWYDAH